jgi:hypothetical protein
MTHPPKATLDPVREPAEEIQREFQGPVPYDVDIEWVVSRLQAAFREREEAAAKRVTDAAIALIGSDLCGPHRGRGQRDEF